MNFYQHPVGIIGEISQSFWEYASKWLIRETVSGKVAVTVANALVAAAILKKGSQKGSSSSQGAE